MRLIVGLGNPGKEHERTRHNVGFLAVERFRERHAETFDGWKHKFEARISTGKIGRGRVGLALPQTFMNRSGDAVRMASAFWKVKPKDVLVVSDDFMLPFGTLRVRREGSAGGHNGLRSVISCLATTAFPRLRIGVGSDRMDRVPKDEFVLERFGKDEERALDDVLDRAADAIDTILTDGIDAAMNAVN